MATFNVSGQTININSQSIDDLVVTEDEREFQIRSARVKLIMRAPAIAIPGKEMEFVATATVKRIATDGQVIYYNPSFLDTVSKLDMAVRRKLGGEDARKARDLANAELRWHLGHVLIHYGFGHIALCDRGSGRELWDTACDIFADNLLFRYMQVLNQSDERFLCMPAEDSLNRAWARDLTVEQIYTRLRAGSDVAPPRVNCDEHDIWNDENQELWNCRLDQAYQFENSKGQAKAAPIMLYIERQIPKATEDQLEALQMMQYMAGIEFCNNYSNMPDDEIASTLQRLAYRSPEDFALIAGRMASDESMRSKMLGKPEWMQATLTHKSYIM